VSGSKRGIVVTRSFSPSSDECVRALELLLKKTVSKEATHPGGPENAKVSSKHDSRARTIIPPKPS